MINFHIPGFYLNYELNKKYIEYFLQNKNQFYSDIKIHSIYDSFPGCSWNGGRNILNNYSLPTEQNIKATISTFNNLNINCSFTFTNLNITTNQLNDPIGNFILNESKNYTNSVIISNDILAKYIKSNYPSFSLISSTTKVLNTIQDLELELEKGYYDLVVPNIKFNNTKELFNISSPSKCEILLNDTCYANCQFRKQHYESITNNQEFFPCRYPELKAKSFYGLLKTNPSHITREDLYQKYVPAGFTHFKIMGRDCTNAEILEFYLYYMAKPEYIDEIRYQIMRTIR